MGSLLEIKFGERFGRLRIIREVPGNKGKRRNSRKVEA